MTAARIATRDVGILIRRAELEGAEAVMEAVWELANGSTYAARWSRTAFHPYFASREGSGALQAKVLFLAYAGESEASTATTRADHPIARVNPIVGFAAFSAILTVGAGEATLENMVVAPQWQRRGIGSRLLEAGLLWCRTQASGTVFLEVRESNRAAITLYERAGFLAVGNRPGYYREPTEDGLQMQKTWMKSPEPAENSPC